MANNLPVSLRGAGIARIPERAVAKTVGQIKATAIIDAAEIQAKRFVVSAGLHAIADLADEEARLLERSPLAARRLQVAGDIGASKIIGILERLQP